MVMLENQNTEWKSSWQDEYFKWICGFANAQGGTLVVGKNDAGRLVGLGNARKFRLPELDGVLNDISENDMAHFRA